MGRPKTTKDEDGVDDGTGCLMEKGPMTIEDNGWILGCVVCGLCGLGACSDSKTSGETETGATSSDADGESGDSTIPGPETSTGGSPDPQTTDAPTGQGDSEETTTTSPSTSGGPEELPVLQVLLTVHLEGRPTDSSEALDIWYDDIRQHADTFDAFAATPTWEARSLFDPIELGAHNIFAELAERGHGTGVHADAGGNPGPGFDQAAFDDELAMLKTQAVNLGIAGPSVSGICSTLNWVEAARAAGFEVASGQVEYCLKSLPEEDQPASVVSCDNPADCHGQFPTTVAEQLVPWRAEDGSNWTTPSTEGLLLVHSFGGLQCLGEEASGEGGPCVFDQDDADTYVDLFDEALATRVPGELNTFLVIWSMGVAVDGPALESMLSLSLIHI
ncbi:MAG: hypothetical protein KUG77_10720 [Nannocystaceae bacterium]|nr:hypothetical protein [Nannocystaceae bacterium]